MGCSCGKSKNKKENGINSTDEKIEANGKKAKQPKDKKENGNKNDKSAQEYNDSSKNSKKSPSRNGSAKSVNKPSGVISTAKVRPLTPKVAPQNVPKPVAFEIELNQNGDKENTEVTELISGEANGGISKMPRKLPKLSSLNKNADENKLSEDALLNKQKKAEEKRLEILESKKQKARKFLIKFGNSSINDNGVDDSNNETNSEDANVDATNNKETNDTNNSNNGDNASAADQIASGPSTSGEATTTKSINDAEGQDNLNVVKDGPSD